MSSINPYYTFHYSQPEEYHFSHDSVFLARRAFEILQNEDVRDLQGLDLCAGCGIIGLDFLFHFKQQNLPCFKSFDFLEVQEIYQEHFNKNLKSLNSATTSVRFINKNYIELIKEESSNTYDLILCNPPYFHSGQGKLSPSDFKNRCRFFLDSDFKSLLQAIENSLALNGRGFILLRSQKEHGWDVLEEARSIFSTRIKMSTIEEIRGTNVILVQKISLS